ncbi:MAG: murein biosynthesis integral membrane protein MurJ, partial [Propionibacteriaceae bacterium]|nr:murein biosynthesis integral membrane protein MurJ [Propionibacteriaceae bacterium]
MSESNQGNKRLLAATAIQASGTLVSRALGLVRKMLLVGILGASAWSDTFEVGTYIPNSLYMILAGGVLTSVLVPHIVHASKRDDDGGEAFINRFVTLFVLALAVLTVVLTVLTPWVLRLFVDMEVWSNPEHAAFWPMLTLMCYITMPQVFFYGVFFVLSQVLNAKERFGPEKWAPVLNNVIAVLTLAIYALVFGSNFATGQPFSTAEIVWLGLGSTLGIIAQAGVLVVYVQRLGIKIRPRFDFLHTGLWEVFRDAMWMVGYVILTQIMLMVNTRLASSASFAGAGVTAYNTANLIWLFPHSLVTISLATAILPSSARASQAGDNRSMMEAVSRALRLAATFIIPAAMALILLAEPITRVLFGNGNGAETYHYITWTLACMAIGLVPYSLQYIYLRVFYAQKDFRTPFLIQCVTTGVNVALAFTFVYILYSAPTTAPRLALAAAGAYTVGFFVTRLAVKKRLSQGTTDAGQVSSAVSKLSNSVYASRGESVSGIGRLSLMLLVAATPAVLLAWVAWFLIGNGRGVGLQALGLVVGVAVALGVYFGIAKALKIPEVGDLIDVLTRRGGRGSDGGDGGGNGNGSGGDQTGPANPSSGLSSSSTSSATPTTGSAAPSPSSSSPSPGWPRGGNSRAHQPGLGSAAGAAAGLAGSTVPPVSALSGTRPPAASSPVGQTPLYDFDLDEYFPEQDAFVNKAGQPVQMEGTEQLLADPDGKGVFIKVMQPDDPLYYSIPPSELTSEIMRVQGPGQANALLAHRYRLEGKLSERAGTELWRAFDEVLDRWVLVYLLTTEGRATDSLLRSARKAALATDARFLRVLDVVADPVQPPSYVVYEYAPGVTLANILQDGPLSGQEIAWIVRDVADAIAKLHALGLSHGRLNPATVMITDTGNVKITGLLAAETEKDAQRSFVAEDVRALGKLLYAGLTGRWIGGPAFGLPGVDLGSGLADPDSLRQVADASVLNVVDRILRPRPVSGTKLTSAAQVTTQLSLILGPMSAASQLRARLNITDDNALVSQIAPPTPIPAFPGAVLPDISDGLGRPGSEAGEGVSSNGDVGFSAVTGAVKDGSSPVRPKLLPDYADTDDLTAAFADNESLLSTPVPPPSTKRSAPIQRLVDATESRPVRASLVIGIVAIVFAALSQL